MAFFQQKLKSYHGILPAGKKKHKVHYGFFQQHINLIMALLQQHIIYGTLPAKHKSHHGILPGQKRA
jgi:hypothetical protein